MVIAAGSYPAGRWFESDRRYQKRPHGQAVKTSPFHGGNPSSSLGGVTKQREAALSERFFHRRITPHGGLAQLVRALALQARGHRFKSGSLHHLAARRISRHPAGKPCRVFALTPAARFPLASRTLPHKVSSLRFAPLWYFAGTPSERLQSVGVRILFVLPTLAGALRAFRARRISQHPAGKPCRVFALTPAVRFPLASRTLPHKVSSLRFAPLRYFAGTPFERLQSGCVWILSVLPTLAGALRAFRARRISQHPAGKSCRVFALTPAARFPLASRPPPYRVLCILSFFVLPTLAGALRRRWESHRLRCADCTRK